MTKSQTGPRGGMTTIAPCGWQKTTVYLRPDQNRKLKQAALDRDRTMSEILRHAIDCYLGLSESDSRLSEAQRAAVKEVLREHFAKAPENVDLALAALDAGDDR